MIDPPRDFADKMFRDLLLKPDNLQGFLFDAVPQIAQNFIFSKLNQVPPRFLLPDGRGKEADLLFEIPYRLGNEERLALVCVLIENQSRPDRLIPLRMLLSLVLYWEKQWSVWLAAPSPKDEFRLSMVLPIVFYTGLGSWGSARSIADLLAEPEFFRQFSAPDLETVVLGIVRRHRVPKCF